MSMRQVPNELLLEIFRSLPRHTITALSLTCRKFKDISRPFLFTHLHFHPYSVRDDAILLPPSIVIDGALECLEFWTSDEIAPHVRSCKITPSEDTMVWHQNDESKWEILEFSIANPDSHYTLLDLFFERLGAFTRLRSFHAELVHFTQARLATLCRAPTLIDVQLVGCGVVAGERIDTTSLQLATTRFSFAHKDVASAREGLGLWLPLLHPDHLREVELKCNSRVLGENLAPCVVFPSVRRLTTTMDYSTMSYNLSILSRFPAVDILSTNGAEYSETQDHLSHSAQLDAIQGFNNILSLHVTFDSETDMFRLGHVCSFFPKLAELCVRLSSQVEVSSLGHIYYMAGVHILGDPFGLPSELKRIAFTWNNAIDTISPTSFRWTDRDRNNGDNHRRRWQPAEHDIDLSAEFAKLRDALVKRYTSLEMIWLDGHHFLFRWRKSLNSVEEGVAKTHDHASEMRGEFDTFWETQGKTKLKNLG